MRLAATTTGRSRTARTLGTERMKILYFTCMAIMLATAAVRAYLRGDVGLAAVAALPAAVFTAAAVIAAIRSDSEGGR